MTKQDLVAQLAEMGVNVNADKFDIPKLKKMIVALGGEPAPKAKKQPKVPRPDNVQVVQQIPAPGKYIVSFNLQMHVKDRAYNTKFVTEEYTADGVSTEKQIAKEIAERFVTENDQFLHDYDDGKVEIMGMTKIRFTEKEDIAIREVKARNGQAVSRRPMH